MLLWTGRMTTTSDIRPMVKMEYLGKGATVHPLQGRSRETKAGKELREYLKHYYNSAASAVPWQQDMI